MPRPVLGEDAARALELQRIRRDVEETRARYTQMIKRSGLSGFATLLADGRDPVGLPRYAIVVHLSGDTIPASIVTVRDTKWGKRADFSGPEVLSTLQRCIDAVS